MKVSGNAICYGNDVNTDVIVPARYLYLQTEAELAAHCMEDLDPTFLGRVQTGDIIAAGENFGCGSSREHAPMALKGCGIAAVVAKSFARIFYRNAINTGLAIVECDAEIAEGDTVEIDFDNGTLKNLTKGTVSTFAAFPPFLQKIIAAGGLMNAIGSGAL